MAAKLENFLMLAHKYEEQNCAGWWMSEKLDGMRAVWIPHSRELDCSRLPFAQDKGIATGLWSRYGKIIHAPSWWLDKLPTLRMYDGELWLGRGKFQPLMSIVKRDRPDERWKNVHFKVFDSPWKIIFSRFGESPIHQNDTALPFERLGDSFESNNVIALHEQIKLPHSSDWKEVLTERLFDVTTEGGEGLMLRSPGQYWEPKRIRNLLKVKPMHDADGVVTGYNPGAGRHEGRLGSLLLRLPSGKMLAVSGFTDSERDNAQKLFPIGTVVTFKYRELTLDGIPKEARYWRKKPVG